MARVSKFLTCPACGEKMKVAVGAERSKVCCPHCRQTVMPEQAPPEIKSFEVLESVPEASRLLEEIFLACEEKRRHLLDATAELAKLERKAEAIGAWLQTIGNKPVEDPRARALAEIQTRLFEQLKTLEAGELTVVNCDAEITGSLASNVAVVFRALGWNVELTDGVLNQHCGEDITFFVAPGPVSHPVAKVYFALIGAGLRLHSRITLEQDRESAALYVHRLSTIPKLLPSPKPVPVEVAAEELRKTA